MTPGQRAAANRASWTALAISIVAIAAVYYWRASLFANTYQLNVEIHGDVAAARAFVVRALAPNGLPPALTATGVVYRSGDRNALAQIPATLGARYDLQRAGPGEVQFGPHTQIVFVGPFLRFGPTDAAFLIEAALVAVALGVGAFRNSMHPAVVCCEIALAGSMAVSLIALRWHAGYPLLTAYIAIFLLANVALVRWLWITRDRWPGTMRASYWGVIAALMVVDIANALTLVPK